MIIMGVMINPVVTGIVIKLIIIVIMIERLN